MSETTEGEQTMAKVARKATVSKTDWKSFEVIADSERDHEGWLTARGSGLGASESATVFGCNPYESPYSLYARKRGELEAQAESEPMEWGHRLEPVIAQAFQDKTGRIVWKHPLGGMLLRSRECPWLLATPDYEQRAKRLATDGLLELKSTGAQHAEEWNDDVPLQHQIQVQQQLLVTNRRYASVAVLIGGNRFLYKHLSRDEKFLKTLVKKTQRFWQMIQDGTPPAIDASESTIATLKQMREEKTVISLPPEVLRWHDQMLAAAERRKAAEEEEKEAKREISALMGLASRGLLPEGKGMYKFETKKGYDVKAHTVAPSRQLKFSIRTDV
jgi:putative phage-type endonuclease